MDTAASIHSTSIMSPHDYAASLLKLKNRAHDLQEQGKTELAIEMWQEALELAEEQQDTLTNKTEILCRLVQLHLKLAYAQEMDTLSISDDEEEEEVNPQRMARRQSQLIRPGLLETFHHLTAKRYLHRIIPGLVQPAWLGPPTKQLMDFFNQVQAWEVAIIIADQLLFQEGLEQDHEKLATMHYQVASQKLDAQRNAEALQHLQATVTYLQKVPIEQRDMVLYLQVLHLLATEYQAQQEYDSAMETCKEQMIHTPPQKRPSLHCQIARNYLAMGQLDTALEQIDLAKKLHLEVAHEDIRLQILQIKGDVFFRLGRHEESLECYEQALHEVASSPADKAELLYTMGRLCVKLGRVRSAITYFTRELAITKQELGSNHLSVSRVLHQLAKLYDEGLGEHKMALLKYNKALGVELAVLQECHVQVTACVNCNPVTHRMCSRHGNMQRQISTQIRETKRCQGRVHYKLGDLERAMQTSFSEPSPRGRERRHTLR
jgi:tetratricopeptide (TPR) repeat protein